ncbi:MAG TPA: hypothetical protein PKC39_10750 [Ferruginibacter sp.]|nr:hypothetical protein [Ferruginibacter sp.]HMP21427.1 hypothetical protein [Ferruginibacter sp.]
MKLQFTGNSIYLLKAIGFLCITAIAYYYFGNTTIREYSIPNNKLTTVFGAGFNAILYAGIHFYIFIHSLHAPNPKPQHFTESIVVAAIVQFLFFILGFYDILSIPHFVCELLLLFAIAGVLTDNIYSRKIVSARTGFTIAFSILYGLWLSGYFRSSGIPPQSNLEVMIALYAGISLAQACICLVAFVVLGKILFANKNYREIVALPLSILSLLAIMVWIGRLLW